MMSSIAKIGKHGSALNIVRYCFYLVTISLLLNGCDLEAEQRQAYFDKSSSVDQQWQQQPMTPTEYQACGAAQHPCLPVTTINK